MIKQSWSAGAWVNSTRTITEYSGVKTTQEASFKWQNDAWIGTSRSDYSYNAAGLNDTIKTYTDDGTGWIYSRRTINTFNAKDENIMTHISTWNGEHWVLSSMTRKDEKYDAVGNKILYATWKCGSDSVWIGVQKDSVAYSASGDVIYSAHFESWANNDWVPVHKVEYVYDDAGRKIIEQSFNWSNNAWRGIYKYEYEFDSNGKQTAYITYDDWNTTTNSWIGSSKEESVYNTKRLCESKTTYRWKNNQWTPVFHYIYIYDASDREIEQIAQTYSNSNWENANKYEKEYSGSKLVKSNEYVWQNGQWTWFKRNESYYDADAQAKLRREIIGSWSHGVVQSFTDNRYFYNCDSHAYIITFANYDGTVLSSTQVAQGETPAYNGETPTKPATAQYTYTFNGWDKDIVVASANATYTATFTETLNKYTITFKNGDEVLQTGEVEYGTIPTYSGQTPTKASDAQYTYTFAGWDNEIVVVTGEATYTATYTQTVNKYTITFQNEDGSVIEAKEYEYGATPVAPADPTKEATAQYTYTFSGWDNTIAAVTGVATYKATFSSIVNKYTITWVDGDGNILSTEQVAYGDTPAYTGNTPTKTATDEYTYEFNNSWSPAIVPVTGDATYTALFTETGITPSTYIVTFMDDEGNVLFYEMYSYGQTPDPSYEVGKESDAQYDYTFAGWSPALGPVTGDVTYTATFTATVRSYTISFVNDDGTTLYEQVLEYGQMPEYVGDVPTKQDDELYTYTFSGWSPEIEVVAGTATYTATYTAELKIGSGISAADSAAPATKVMENGILYIIRSGQKYTSTGAAVE